MKPFLAMLLAGVLLAAAPAHGQGLLAIGQNSDFPESIPLTFNIAAGGGYDSNPGSLPSGSDFENVDSYFINGGVGLIYAENDRVTRWNLGADFGVIQYLDDVERADDFYYNARVAFNISHDFSRRLSVSNNFYLTYEIEPDYSVGVTASRRAGQYLYGYDNLAVAYAWSERFSTTTGYTIEGIRYMDNDLAGASEDRTTQIFSQQFSYAWSRTTKLIAEYRFGFTNFANSPSTSAGVPNADYMSHYILAGVDQAWSDRTTTSLRAGAEFYQSDRGDEVGPYLEASLNYAISRKTTARLYAQAGYDASELGLYDSNYAFHLGFTTSHQFTERLSGSAGLHYVHNDYNGNGEIESSSDDEIDATIGLSYNFWSNLSLDASYSYTTISSDTELRDYDRHRVNLGLNATF